jgi:hypothetical protein
MEFVQNIIMPSTTIEYEDEAYKWYKIDVAIDFLHV